MTEDIIEAVCAAIYTEFGEGYELYTEAVAQNMQTPCFFVMSINPKLERFLGNRYLRHTPIAVQYFPSDEQNARSECEAAAEKLFLILDQIPFDNGYINGTQVSSEIADGILNFFITYDFFVNRQEAAKPVMRNLTTTQEVR